MKTQKFILFAVLFIIYMQGFSQQKPGLYLSVNPLSVLEPQAAYGMGVGFRINEDWEISTEYALIKPNILLGEGKYTNLNGSRSVTQLKYTVSVNEYTQSKFFIGLEYRNKNYSFTDVADFTLKNTGATLKEVQHTNNTQVNGYGFIIGKQYDLGVDSKWAIEFLAGVGVRVKTINREGVPENSYIVAKDLGFGETPNYLNNYKALYFPVGIRLMVRL